MATTGEADLPGGVVHDLPQDLAEALKRGPAALAAWRDITPLARNEWICWTITCAKAETRAKHIVVMKDKMHKGERRPCCWVGCVHRTDKPMSSTQKWVLSRQPKAS